ncbi:MAG: hypothetical protein NC489_08500 [Ruminococcus flavefaciens]|nr:hypothetical protein [Ruminococcus flavefaciens]
MGKKHKNKKGKNQYREEVESKPNFTYHQDPAPTKKDDAPKQRSEEKPAGYTRDEERRDQGKFRPKQEVEHHPVAILLQDEMIRQITEFLEGPPTDESANRLFNLGSYPARLTGCDGAEDYEAFQLDRSVRLNKENPEKLNRLSTIIVIQNIATHKPAFLVQAFISPNYSARVIIHQQDDKGTIYRNTLRWSKD